MPVFYPDKIFGGNPAVYENQFAADTMASKLGLVLLAWPAPDQWSSCCERVRTVSGYGDLAESGKMVTGAGGL